MKAEKPENFGLKVLFINLKHTPWNSQSLQALSPLQYYRKIPCLNVHPGDLTVLDDKGNRILTGLHAIPIELAVINGIDHLRTTVIIASAFSSSGAGMDEGAIIGVSPEVKIDYQGVSIDEYKAIYNSRQGKISDKLRDMANDNQEKLKVDGDWIVFPPSVNDFASGRFAINEEGLLHLESNGNYLPIEYIEYQQNQKEIVFSE